MERVTPIIIEERCEQAGKLPTVEDFAGAIADTCTNSNLVNGKTLSIGSTKEPV